MTLPARCFLLKIYVGEGYQSHGTPVYEAILWEAKRQKLHGATVIKCDMGFGHVGVVQQKNNPPNDDLPVLVEFVDSPEKIQEFLPAVVKLLGNHGLVLIDEVTVAHCGYSTTV